MDNYQKIDQIINKTGVSYEDAKAALEGCGWDMIDAVISLEREGKVNKETVEHTVENAAEAVEIIPEVTVEKSADDGSSGNQDYSGNAGSAEDAPKSKPKLWTRIKRILTKNRMVVLKSSGQQIADLPIWIPVLALIAFFWATLILAVLAMIFGCRFHFEGEDLGKTNINNTMDKATDYAEKVKNDLAGKVNGGQNTDNRR
ncbi:MAG: hypothetical protein IJJ31_04550 [Mogibacterium sp.]|nr:hypothetical protein [Mogibacterium sp.]